MPVLTKEDKRAILSGILVWFLTQIFGQLIGWISVSYYGQTLFILSNYALWFAIGTVIALFYVMLAHHVRKQQIENMPMVSGAIREPDHIMGTYNRWRFGVRWKVKIGTSYRELDKPYARTDDPHCPKCDYKLDSYTKLSFIGWKDRYYWRCEPCNRLYRRPDKTLFREDKVVKKLAMRDFLRRR